jgi:hypothetical protein
MFSPRRSRAAALCVSGAISALAGACWLLDDGTATVMHKPIGDLRVLAGVMLAGALLFTGSGRTLLAGLCLPPAMLLATAWRQGAWAWDMQLWGFDGQCLQLAMMVLCLHVATRIAIRSRGPGRWSALGAALLLAAGVLLTACVATADGSAARKDLYVAGLAAWFVGIVVIAVVLITMHRRFYRASHGLFVTAPAASGDATHA